MTAVQKQLSMLGALVVLAGGGAAAWWVISTNVEKDTKQKDESEKVMAAFDKAKVKALRVEAKGETIELQRDGDDWKITAPRALMADKATVDAILDKLAELKSKRVVDEKVEDLSIFGLKPPVVRIEATRDTPADTDVLLVGKENAFDNTLYAKSGDKDRVLMVDSGTKYPLEKGLFDLRDKRLVVFEEKDVQSLEVLAPKLAWSVERQAGDQWKLTVPIQDRADKSMVDRVLNLVKGAHANRYAEEDMTDVKALKKYGLDKPVVSAVFTLGADKKKVVLLVGEVDDKGTKTSFARRSDLGWVAQVDTTLPGEFDKPLFDLRHKLVSEFDREKVHRLELKLAGADEIVISRKKEAPAEDGGVAEEQFAFVKPDGGATAKKWKISSALYSLGNLRAAALAEESVKEKDLAKYGLDKPAREFAIYGEKDELLGRVVFGKEDGSKVYVATAPGAGQRVWQIEKTTADDLPKSLDDVREPPPAPPVPESKPAESASSPN